MHIQEGRPPYVRFATIARPDNGKSHDAGHVVYENVDIAYITPAGSKDELEKIAPEWIQQIKRQSMHGQYPAEWVKRFEMAYEEWKKGNELPPEGTPIQHWPVATPAEIAQCLAGHVRTVEDLAELPESGLQLLGMGGRVLRDKARGWLQAAQDHGKLAERIAALEAANREKDGIIERQNEKLAELNAAVSPRRRKEAEAA